MSDVLLSIPFRLDPADIHSPTWRKLREHYERRLDELREQNDEHADEKRSIELRTKIAETKALLELGVPWKPIEPFAGASGA